MEQPEQRVLRALRRVIRAVDIHSRKINTAFDVTVPQLLCLYAVQRNPTQTMSQLAEEVSLSGSTVNGIADRLEDKGLLRRVRSGQDRRKVSLELTEKGRAVVDAAPPMLQETFTERFLALPEREREAIAGALEQTVKLLDAERIDASPNLIPDGIVNKENHGNGA